MASKRLFSRKRNPIIAAAVTAVIIIVVLGTLTGAGTAISRQIGSMINASQEIKAEIALFHLRLDEMIQGDPSVKSEDVWSHLADAKWYADAMLEGGVRKGVVYVPLDAPSLRALVTEIVHHIGEIEGIGRRRELTPQANAIGSAGDQEFGLHFNHVVEQSELLEAELQVIVSDKLNKFVLLSVMLGVGVIAFAVAVAFIFRRYERQREAAATDLEESEEKFRSICQTSAVAMIVSINDNGNVTTWNPGAEKAFGYSAGEIIGQPLIRLIPERYREAHLAGMARAVGTGQYRIVGKTVELSGLHKNGHEVPIELSLTAWQSGGRSYFSAVINDISERKKAADQLRTAHDELELRVEERTHDLHHQIIEREYAEEALRQANIELELRVEERTRDLKKAKDEAELANYAKSRFLASMSHELRTPLNGIIGFSEMMKNEMFGTLSDKYKDYATDIRNAGQHLLNVISDILDISKLEKGTLALDEKKFNLLRMAVPCMRLMQKSADSSQITLLLEMSEDLPPLLADETRVKQILLNLLSNAIKFNLPHGRVIVDAEVNDNGAVALRVSDTGCGIAAEDIPMVLKPFGQVDDVMTRTHEGTGLGLSLSNRLAELHGGRLEIESEIGKGTTVTVLFPPERTISLS